MKPNSSAPRPLYLGLDVHKAQTVIAILEPDREAEPRHYGSIATTQHALERAVRRIAKSQDRQLGESTSVTKPAAAAFGSPGGCCKWACVVRSSPPR